MTMTYMTRRPRYPAAWRGAILAVLVVATAAPVHAQGRGGRGGGVPDTTGQWGAPPVRALIEQTKAESDLRLVRVRFQRDLQNLRQRYDFDYSPVRIDREREFFTGWLERMRTLNPSTLNPAGRAEYPQLVAEIEAGLAEQDEKLRHLREWAPLITFGRNIEQLQERRRDRLDVDPKESARIVHETRVEVQRLTQAIADTTAAEFRSITPSIAARAADQVRNLNEILENWHRYYHGFDPLFTWWARKPYEELTEALEEYANAIERRWPNRVMESP